MRNGQHHAIGGRVVKWKGRVASIAPALASVSVIALMTTGAFGQTVISSLETDQVYIDVNQDITITADGEINLFGGNDLAALYIDVDGTGADYSGAVINNGIIDLFQGSATSYPAGIYLEGSLAGGSITNNGDIVVDVYTSSSTVAAVGIYVTGDMIGTITNANTGVIDVLAASDSYSVTAYGIVIDGALGEMGLISNLGTINVEANVDTSSQASAFGVYVGGDIDGGVQNSGTIDVLAAAGTESAFAYGVYVADDVGITGFIQNSGSILVEARASTESSASAYGVYVSDSLAGSIINTSGGVIDVYAHAGTSTAWAYGIYVGGSVEATGLIENAGTILVKAYTPSSSTAYAYGIYVGSDMAGTIDNSGTIDVYAEAGNSDATAYGIYVYGLVTGGISNSGDILVEAMSGTYTAEAYGIYVDDLDVNGTITNSGLIDVYAHSVTYDAEAYGIYVDGNADGTITNSANGVIIAKATAPGSSATAYGVYIDGDLNGDILNAGHIEALAEVLSSDSAEAYGIYVGGDLNGTIDNSGTIAAIANSIDTNASAYGIYVNESTAGMTGDIDNSGTISATAMSTQYWVSAYGIYVEAYNYGMSGTIDNSGTISATVTGEESGGSAYGILVQAAYSGMSGSIDNSGTISASAMSTQYWVSAYGIYLNSQNYEMSGSIDNSGTISATATGEESGGSAYGILVTAYNGGMSGTIDNSGTISATATSTNYWVSAYGIYVNSYNGGMSGTIENSGTISATATTESSGGSAYGILVKGEVSGTIDNSGTISVNATGENTNWGVEAYGVQANNVGSTGTITNSGSISVEVNSTTGPAYAAGVNLQGMAGHFINTGSIVAVLNGGVGEAIYVYGDGGLVTLNTSGFIEGDIVLEGNIDLNVQGDVGRSVNWTVDTSGTTGGLNFINDEGYLGTTVFIGENSYEGQFATFDSSGLAAVRQAGADAGFIGLDALLSQTRNAAAKPVQVTNGNGGGNTFMPFVAAATKSVTYGDSDTMLDQDITTSSLSFGGTMAMDSGLSFGLGAGMMTGTATVDYIDGPSSETDQQGAFIGLAMGGSSANLNFAGAISGGRMQFDNTRYVNDNTVPGGIVTEEASFNSTFMAAEFAVSGRFDIGSGMALVPNTTLRYAKHKVDGYVETGTDGAADVGPQNFGVFEGEIGVALEKAMGNGVFSGGISVMSRSVTGDEDVLVTMIDDNHLVDATIGSSTAAKLSLGYSSSFSASGQFNVGVETLVGSSGMSGGKISGEVRFSF